jgi:hypothetical protein
MGILYQRDQSLVGARRLLEDDNLGQLRPQVRFLGLTSEPAAEFSGIGSGRPLSIEIRHVYTGREPRSDWANWGDKDMLITSSLKSITDYPAAVRAVNLFRTDVAKYSNVRRASASEPGTPLVYYSPASTVGSLVVTIEVFFDNFPDDAVTAFGDMLKNAAGIPVFATAGVFLVGGSIVAGILAKLGKAIFDGTPIFRETEEVIFFSPGQKPSVAGLALLVPDAFAERIRAAYKLSDDGVLVDKLSGERYQGDAPYVVLSLDGTIRPELEKFQATKISAELLDRFASSKSGISAGMDALVDGSQAYSDLSFRRRADALRDRLKGDPSSEDYKAAKAQWDAYVKNIRNAELRPQVV